MDERTAALRFTKLGSDGRPWDLLQRHDVQGHQPREIADRLGLEAGHVRVLLNRVRDVLRPCVSRRLVGGAPQ